MFLLAANSTEQPIPEVLAQMLMVIGVVAIGILLTISVRNKIAKRRADTPAPRQRIAEAKQARHLSEDKHAVASDLHETARRLAASIDNKSERLEQLIAEAERRIAELQSLVDDSSPNGRIPAELRDEAERITQEVARQLPPEPESLKTMEPVATTRPLDPLTRSVYELADSGHDTISIAQTLDEQIGKVELILALRED